MDIKILFYDILKNDIALEAFKVKFPGKDIKEYLPLVDASVELRARNLHSVMLSSIRQILMSFSYVYKLVCNSHTINVEKSNDPFSLYTFQHWSKSISSIPISLKYGEKYEGKIFQIEVENLTTEFMDIYSDSIKPNTKDPLFCKNIQIGIMKPGTKLVIDNIVLKKCYYLTDEKINTTLAISGPIKHNDKKEVITKYNLNTDNVGNDKNTISEEIRLLHEKGCSNDYTVKETVEPSMDSTIVLYFTGIENGDEVTIKKTINNGIDMLIDKFDNACSIVKKLRDNKENFIVGNGYSINYTGNMIVLKIKERKIFCCVILSNSIMLDCCQFHTENNDSEIKFRLNGVTKIVFCDTLIDIFNNIIKIYKGLKIDLK